MSDVLELLDIVERFPFAKGDYVGAEEQLSKFAENYALLSAEDAELLRGEFSAKDRLGWLRIASSLFMKVFAEADPMRKEKLCRIFFALYSFENLEFGFDGVMDVISVAGEINDHVDMAKRSWEIFSDLTSNDLSSE